MSTIHGAPPPGQLRCSDLLPANRWEGRFKSQALIDEKALVACMAYVELNPIRAGIAETPEESDYTSIQTRISTALSEEQPLQPASLMPFVGNPRKEIPKGLPFKFTEYLELVDWTGRALRDDKLGAIPANLPPVQNSNTLLHPRQVGR